MGGHGLDISVLRDLDTLSSHKARDGRQEGGREGGDGWMSDSQTEGGREESRENNAYSRRGIIKLSQRVRLWRADEALVHSGADEVSITEKARLSSPSSQP